MEFSVFLHLFLALCFGSAIGYKCVKQINSCACQTDYYGAIVNFSALDLARTEGNKARFMMAGPIPQQLFEYNPCSGFDCILERSAAACLVTGRKFEELLGIQNTSKFLDTPDNNSIIISYTNDDLRTDVYFFCVDGVEGEFALRNVTGPQYFEFRVNTSYACLSIPPTTSTTPFTTTITTTIIATSIPTGTTQLPTSRPPVTINPRPFRTSTPGGPTSAWDGNSVSGIILLVLFNVICVYLLLGVLINKFVNKKSGLETIPNGVFWIAFCYNIVLGWKFIWGLIIDHVRKRDYVSFSVNTNLRSRA